MPQSAQLTALLAASVTCAYPDVSIDVAYGFSGAHHNDLAQRSMHSVIATASPATLARLRFHIFSDDAAYQEGTFGTVPVSYYRNVSVTKTRKVWDRRYSAKLEHWSNYVRFYVAAALRAREAHDGRSHAEKFLYLDTDTLALHDIGPVYDGALRYGELSVASGVQRSDVCWFGKMVRVADPMLRNFSLNPHEKCLTASVMIVHIDRWLRYRLRERIEDLLRLNTERQLWYLGSMPPLMVALGHRGWERLPPSQIVDMKARVCCAPSEEATWREAVLLHPVKQLGPTLGIYTHIIHHSTRTPGRLLLRGNSTSKCDWPPQDDATAPLRLRILVFSSRCDGMGCEDHFGGTRIWGTNLGQGLGVVGHHVIFASRCPGTDLLRSADVVLAAAIDNHTPLVVAKHRVETRSWRPVLVATKTNLAIGRPLDPAFDFATAGSHLHAVANLHFNHVALNTSVILRHFEVPTSYWRDRPASVYGAIPRHVPRRLEEHALLRLCYHGNPYHMSQEPRLLQGLLDLAEERAIHLVLLGARKTDAARIMRHEMLRRRAVNLTIDERAWVNVDYLFSTLAHDCDLGLVPNSEGHDNDPGIAFSKVQGIKGQSWGQVTYKYKVSANAGRALVMAQVGLPFVATPELEVAELLGNARLPAADIFAIDDWKAKIAALTDGPHAHERRGRMSDNLRAYCEAHYTIETFVDPLNVRLKKLIAMKNRSSSTLEHTGTGHRLLRSSHERISERHLAFFEANR